MQTVRRSLRLLLVVLALFVSLVGCGNQGDPALGSGFDALELDNAEALLLLSGGLSSADLVSASTYSLFKYTNEGTLERVQAIKGGQALARAVTPEEVYVVGSNFVVLGYQSTAILVRFSDGAAFDLGSPPPINWRSSDRIQNRSPYQQDASGALYFPVVSYQTGTENRLIYKVTNPNARNPTRQRVTPTSDFVNSFVVGASGQVAYAGTPQSRVVGTSGQLLNIPNQSEVWSNPDGEIFYSGVYGDSIYRVVLDGNGNPTSELWADFPDGVVNPISPAFGNLLEVGGRQYYVRLNYSGPYLFSELYNESATPAVHDGHNLAEIKAAGTTTSRIFLAGTTEAGTPHLLRWNPNTNEFTDAIQPGTLDVYELASLSSNTLLVGATRMSDGARVIATINQTGGIRILETSVGKEVSRLIRVN